MRKILFYNLLIVLVALTGCQKDLDLYVPEPSNPVDTWYTTVTNAMPVGELKTNLLLPVYKDSFDLDNTTVSIGTSSGLQVGFDPGAIATSSNVPVTGKIYIETHLLKKKGDMIRMGTPTTSNGRLLVSGGELYIRLKQNGNDLQILQQSQQTNGAHYSISYSDPQPSALMKLFNGDATNPVVFNWLPDLDTSNRINAQSGALAYMITTNQLNWINCDQFYDTTGIPRTIVSAALPANFTNANSIAFTVFNDMNSVVGMYGNATSRKFSSGKIPADKQITVVVISKQGNDYYLGHQQALTVGSSGTIGSQDITVTPVISSLDAIKAYLDTL